MTTKIIHTSQFNQRTRLSKKTQNAGDVEENMILQVADRKRLCVIRVTKKVTYHHAVKMFKTFAQRTKEVKAQEKEETKAKEKVKMIAEQIRLIRMNLVKPVNSVVSIINRGNRARN